MWCLGKTNIVSSILGLIVVLMVPVCALAQADWQIQPNQENNTYLEQNASQPPSHWPPTEANRPLATAPGSEYRPTYTPQNTNIVQANYEEPSPTAASQDPPRLFNAEPTPGQPAEEHKATLPRRSEKFLPARGSTSQTEGNLSGGLDTLWTTGGALALVLGIFFIFTWIARRAAPKTTQSLPTGVVEILGRVPLAGRQTMHLIRCGGKLLLVNVTTDDAKTLTEITDPAEVDRLVGLCSPSRPGNTTTAFRQVFEQFNRSGRLEEHVEDEVAIGSLFRDSRASTLEARDE